MAEVEAVDEKVLDKTRHEIKPELLKDWKGGNGRHEYAKQPLQELSETIKTRGVMSPIITRKIDNTPYYEIVAGHRRKRAAEIAGLETVPCYVWVLSDEDAKEIQLIENLQRENLHPMEEAEGFAAFLKKYKCDARTLAAKVGKPLAHVHKRLVFTKLCAKASEYFKAGTIGTEYAFQLARLNEAQQMEALNGYAGVGKRDGASTVNQLREWIEEYCLLDLSDAPFKLDDAALCPAAGACTACPKRTGADKLLFDDIQKGDFCLDAKCFAQKKMAGLNAKVEAIAEKEGVEPVKLSNDTYVGKKEEKEALKAEKVLAYEKWKPCEKDAKAAQLGVIVHGRDAGKVQYFKKENRYGGGSTSTPSKASKESIERSKKADAQRALEERIESEANAAVVKAVLEKIGNNLHADELRELLAGRISYMPYGAYRSLCMVFGWEPKSKKTGDPDYHTAFDKGVKAAGTKVLSQLFVGLEMLESDEDFWTKRHKIDAKAIRQAVREKLTPKPEALADAKDGAPAKVASKPAAAAKPAKKGARATAFGTLGKSKAKKKK